MKNKYDYKNRDPYENLLATRKEMLKSYGASKDNDTPFIVYIESKVKK